MVRKVNGILALLLLPLLWGCSGTDGGKDGGKDGGQPMGNEREMRTRVQNDLIQIGLAMHGFHDSMRALPSAQHGEMEGPFTVGWRVALLPYLEQGPLYNAKVQGRSPRSLATELAKTDVPLYSRLPGQPSTNHTPFRVFVGPGTPFEKGKKISFANVTDGLANTILVVEAAESVPWGSDQELEYHPDKPLPKLGGHFKGGFYVLFGDGSVRFLSDKVDEKTLRAMITRDGGEAFSPE